MESRPTTSGFANEVCRQPLQQQLAQRQAQVQALQGDVAARGAEAQILRQAFEGSLGNLPQLTQQLTEVVSQRQSGSGETPSLVDTKGIGKPNTFKDEENKFQSWVRKHLTTSVMVLVSSMLYSFPSACARLSVVPAKKGSTPINTSMKLCN